MHQKPGVLAFKTAMLLLSAALLLLGHCLGATVRDEAAAAVVGSTPAETRAGEEPPVRSINWQVARSPARR